MSDKPDISVTLFDDQAPANGSFTYSSAVQARKYAGGVDLVEVKRVCIAGLVNTLGSATLLTFIVETAPADSGPWAPLGYFDTPSSSAGVSTAVLNGLRWTRATADAIPSVVFEPDQAFFRVGVKANNTGASVDLTAFLSQEG